MVTRFRVRAVMTTSIPVHIQFCFPVWEVSFVIIPKSSPKIKTPGQKIYLLVVHIFCYFIYIILLTKFIACAMMVTAIQGQSGLPRKGMIR